MQLSRMCDRIIRIGFYLLFILVPLVLTPWNFELFEFNKMLVTYGLTVIIVGAWVVKMMTTREIRIAKTPLDILIALFVLSQLVSALFSIDGHVSWFGYYSRFNGGMWSIISYVALYYACVSNITNVSNVLKVTLTTAAVVALYGVAERLGIDKNLWVQDVQSRVFSTLGQPNWLAAYLVALIPTAIAFTVMSLRDRSDGAAISKISLKIASSPAQPDPRNDMFVGIIYLLIAVLFFTVVLFTRSRSGLLGLAIADIIFWLLVSFSSKHKNGLRIPFVICHLSFVIVIFFNGTYIDGLDKWVTLEGWKTRLSHTKTAPPATPRPSGTLLEYGGTESGTIRKYVWQGAINAWQSSLKTMIIGTGTETFAFAFYQYRPVGHNLTSEWDFLYNKAHNEYLNYLATTGLFGLGSYLLFIGMFIWWFVKMLNDTCQMIHKSNKQLSFSIGHLALDIGLFAGWTSILITNFFGFSVVIIQLLFFLFPAMVFTLRAKTSEYITLAIPKTWNTLGIWATVGAMLLLLGSIALWWQADTLYASGNRLARSGQQAQAQLALTQAIALRPGEPTYHDELASTLAQLTLAALEEKNATLAAQLAKRSLAESDRVLTTEPKNVNFWKTRTKLFYSFSSFDPTFNDAAIEALTRAQSLSPNDPKIAYNLAILYGRQAKYDKALELLKQAKKLKANYRDAYFGLYVFYTELKQPDAARRELQKYLDTVDPTDKEFQQRLTQ